MKLATARNGTRDGQLLVVSRDLKRAIPARDIPTLQHALDDWDAAAPVLQSLYDKVNADEGSDGVPFDPTQPMAPLPRAYQWLDASAFLAHGKLMMKAFNLAKDPQGATPLIYQGGSDILLGACETAQFASEADGIDFEGEFGAILGDVPMAPSEAEARAAIRLFVLVNDWSLRVLAPIEMATGFGWIQAKPATGFGPVAVTPDELGAAWREDKIHLAMRVSYNDRSFGSPFGGAMSFSFIDLIRWAAKTRRLGAGTIIGSGTASEGDPARVGSACIAERRGFEMIERGAAETGFMRFGDRVRMEVLDENGASVFGVLEQSVGPLTRPGTSRDV